MKRDRSKPRERRKGYLTPKQMAFVANFAGDAAEAGRLAGFSPQSVSTLMKNPQVLEAIKKKQEKVIEVAAKELVKKRILNEDFLDSNLAKIIEFGGGHERRGEADRVAALALAYKKERFLPDSSTKTGVFAQFNGVNGGPQPLYRASHIEQRRAQFLPPPVTETNELAAGD